MQLQGVCQGKVPTVTHVSPLALGPTRIPSPAGARHSPELVTSCETLTSPCGQGSLKPWALAGRGVHCRTLSPRALGALQDLVTLGRGSAMTLAAPRTGHNTPCCSVPVVSTNPEEHGRNLAGSSYYWLTWDTIYFQFVGSDHAGKGQEV